MKKYIKRSEANTAIKFPLDCEKGEDYHLMVLSSYSDTFRLKRNELYREAALKANNGKLTPQEQMDLMARLAASTIVGWNLPEEFGEWSPEKAEQLLIDYPEIATDLDSFTSSTENFIEKKSLA